MPLIWRDQLDLMHIKWQLIECLKVLNFQKQKKPAKRCNTQFTLHGVYPLYLLTPSDVY